MLKLWLKANRPRAFALAAISVVFQAMSAYSLYLISPQLNSLIGGNFAWLLRLSLLKLSLDLSGNLLLAVNSYLFSQQSQEAIDSYRQKRLRGCYEGDEQWKPADVQNDLVNNLKVINQDYWQSIFYFVNNVLYAFFVSVAILSFNWQLVLCAWVIALVALFVPKLFEEKSSTATESAALCNQKYLQALEQWLSAIEELRRFSLKKILCQKLGQDSQQLEDARVKRQACLSVAGFAQEVVDDLGIVGVPFLAGLLYFKGQVAFGAIIAAGYLANGVFSSLQEAFSAYISAKSTTKLNEAMLGKLKVQPSTRTEEAQTIIGRGLELNFGGQVLKYPDFTIKAGEKVLIAGPSGCGKSSLLKLLLGQVKPSQGSLTFLNSQGKEIPNPARSFEYLPQAGWIFPGTIADNLTMYDSKKQGELAEVLKEVGLERDFPKAADLDREVSPRQADLSGGQKQKIFLARSLLYAKKVSLMDEPLSALDHDSRQKILPLLLKRPQTLLFVGHNLTADERRQFDQVISLKEGEDFAN